MLVMTTIFISVMQMLPATAYVKMVDVWLIFGQLVPFSEVILLTAMEFIREGDGSGHDDLTSPDGVKVDEEEDEEVKGPKVSSKMFWLKVAGEEPLSLKGIN